MTLSGMFGCQLELLVSVEAQKPALRERVSDLSVEGLRSYMLRYCLLIPIDFLSIVAYKTVGGCHLTGLFPSPSWV